VKLVSLISGGIDSPVATYLMIQRGVEIVARPARDAGPGHGRRRADAPPVAFLAGAGQAVSAEASLGFVLSRFKRLAADLCVPAGDILPGLEWIEGALKLEDGLVLIHDLDRLLSLDEDAAIDRALGAR